MSQFRMSGFRPETPPEPRTLNPPLAQTGGFASAFKFIRLAAVASALLSACPAPAANLPVVTPLLPPYPALPVMTGNTPDAPAPVMTPTGILFVAPFQTGVDRIYWDIPLPRIRSEPTTLLVELTCSDPGALRAVSIHLKSGGGWFSAEDAPPPSTNRHTLAFPRETFRAESAPGAWNRSQTLRLSLWKQAARPVSLTLHTVSTRRDVVAIIQAGDTTAPGEGGFARLLTAHTTAALTRAGIPHTIINDRFDDALAPFKLVLLPWSPSLQERQIRSLNRFITSGGKVIVFYNTASELARTLGIRIDPWRGADGGRQWTAWAPASAAGLPLPARVPHVTTGILPPYPIPGNLHTARTIATWTDTAGRVTDLPACVLSDRGAWFAHTPPRASAAASAFLGALVMDLLPALDDVCAAEILRTTRITPHPDADLQAQSLARMEAARAARQPARVARLAAELRDARATAALASGPTPRAGEVRGVWENGAGRHPRGWDGLFSELSRRGVNTVYSHMQRAGQTQVNPDLAAPVSSSGRTAGADAVASLSAAAGRHGIALHAWVTCWTLDGIDESRRADLSAAGRLMRDAQGRELPWLCPSLPENHTLLLAGLAELARQGVAGIHLDYVRYPEMQGCFAPATRTAFEKQTGTRVTEWPNDVLAGGALADAFQSFRQQEITRFVRAAAETVRAINPAITLSAAVFPSPAAARMRGQDWPGWLRDKILDTVCPMAYTESAAAFAEMLDVCIRETSDPATHLIAGIGTGADESQLDALATAEQILAVRARPLKGFACFAVDDELLGRILPPLRLGL